MTLFNWKRSLASLALAAGLLAGLTPGRAAADTIFTGRLTTESFKSVSLRPGHYVASHRIYLEAGRRYVFDLTSTAFDAYLILRNRTGTVLAEDDDSGGNLNARIVYTPRFTGMYELVVTTFAPRETGAYWLTARRAPARPAADPVFNGRLTAASPVSQVARPGCHFQTHRVHLQAGRRYVFDLTSAQFDAYLILCNDAGFILTEDDDSGGNLNARIVYTPHYTGMHELMVTTFAAGEMGSYRLTARSANENLAAR